MTHPRRHQAPLAIAALVLAALALAPAASAQPLAPPVAALSAGPNPAQIGETINFSATGSTGDGSGSTVSAYEWDLDGDGDFEVNTATVPAASRAYSSSGSITARLRVTDNEGDVAEASVVLRINAQPRAGFIFQPSAPTANQRVTFSSTSVDGDGQIPASGYAWDFDGDGEYGDAVGETVTVSFPKAGKVTVGLRVTDADGASSIRTRQVKVGRAQPRLLSPFPIVRLSGEIRSGGNTEIERLTVRAPSDSKVTVRCRGDSCPFEKKSRRVKRRRVKFPEIEGLLRPGTVLKVYVTGEERVGKFTSFRIRAGAAPKRRDRCLAPGSRKPIFCPGS
jgi:PKD repeat protein